MADAPSLEQFIAQAKPLNPAYSDAALTDQYHEMYPAPAPEAGSAPPLDEFLKQAKPLNPAYSDDQLKEQYTKIYGRPLRCRTTETSSVARKSVWNRRFPQPKVRSVSSVPLPSRQSEKGAWPQPLRTGV